MVTGICAAGLPLAGAVVVGGGATTVEPVRAATGAMIAVPIARAAAPACTGPPLRSCLQANPTVGTPSLSGPGAQGSGTAVGMGN